MMLHGSAEGLGNQRLLNHCKNRKFECDLYQEIKEYMALFIYLLKLKLKNVLKKPFTTFCKD